MPDLLTHRVETQKWRRHKCSHRRVAMQCTQAVPEKKFATNVGCKTGDRLPNGGRYEDCEEVHPCLLIERYGEWRDAKRGTDAANPVPLHPCEMQSIVLCTYILS